MLSLDNSPRAQVVRAGLDVVRRRGMAGLTTRALAQRTGRTQPAVYRHFRSKETLVRVVLESAAQLFSAAVTANLVDAAPAERLGRGLDAFRRFALAEPRLYEALFVTPPATRRPALDVDPASRRSTVFALLVREVSAAMDRSELRRDDATAVALSLAAHAQGLVLLERRGRFRSAGEFSTFFHRSIGHLLAGLR
jgi:AcrR family transcriptional regulator